MNRAKTIASLRARLLKTGLSQKEISKQAGLSKSWVEKFSRGHYDDINLSTLEKLEKFLAKQQA